MPFLREIGAFLYHLFLFFLLCYFSNFGCHFLRKIAFLPSVCLFSHAMHSMTINANKIYFFIVIIFFDLTLQNYCFFMKYANFASYFCTFV